MSLCCDADHDISCQVLNSGKAGKDPQCKDCFYRVEIFDISPCKCGACEHPELLEEGTAQRVIKNKHEKRQFKWVGESRFAVKCPACSATTPLLESPEKAAAEWNRYCGTFPGVAQQ